MPKVEPFDYQKSTNIDEHNQIVNKVNEIVDVVNDVNLDQITPEIDALKTATTKNTTDISQLKISDAEHTEQIATIDSNVDNHAREISALKAKDATHDTEIAELDKVTDALTKEIPNGITLYRDGTGKIKAVISQEDDTTIDSNVLDMIIPYQYDIISGTTSRSFKLDITMSDGTKYTTNDFVIPAGGGTSVSITAITLTKNADNPNKFKVSVKLDDGSTIDSGEIEMVTSVSGTFANNKLTITVNGISSTPITIDTTGTTYTAGNGIKIASGVISIDDTKVALKSDISDMETKTNANATFATKTALTTLQNATKVAVENFAITESADKVTITTTAIDGATSKSEDIPAVTDTMAGIMSADWFKKLKELWNDAHPTLYTLNLTMDFSTFAQTNPKYAISETKDASLQSITIPSGSTKVTITQKNLKANTEYYLIMSSDYYYPLGYYINASSPDTFTISKDSGDGQGTVYFKFKNTSSDTATANVRYGD